MGLAPARCPSAFDQLVGLRVAEENSSPGARTGTHSDGSNSGQEPSLGLLWLLFRVIHQKIQERRLKFSAPSFKGSARKTDQLTLDSSFDAKQIRCRRVLN